LVKAGSSLSWILPDIPQMNSGTAWTIADGGVPGKPWVGCAVLPGFQRSRTTSDPAMWPFFLATRHTPSVVMTHPPLQLLRWGWPWSQSVDQPQDFLEQFLRHRDLGHLEDDVAAIAHDLGAGLHEFFPQARQRPLLDRLRQSKRYRQGNGACYLHQFR
jgi:hypothetical protein